MDNVETKIVAQPVTEPAEKVESPKKVAVKIVIRSGVRAGALGGPAAPQSKSY
ncbi:MAG: hypothetical protein U0271_47675 [Polyangiaceae bacterium]